MGLDHVYVVATGERAEGHDPVTAYTSFVAALADARTRRGLANLAWEKQGDGYWMASPDGVTQVWILRLPLDGKPDLPAKAYSMPRGVCAICGEERPLRGDGMLQRHRRPDENRDRRWWLKCPGSHQPPKTEAAP